MSEIDDIFEAPRKEHGEDSGVPFDREEWLQMKKAEREHAYELIDQAATMMQTSTEMTQTYLDLQSRFPRYSVSNVLLLAAQKPDATRIGDFKAWKEKGINIKRGETGIIILEPGKEYKREDGSVGVNYYTKRVFDVSQTDASEPEVHQVHRDGRLLLKALLNNAPCEVRIDNAVHFPGGRTAAYSPQDRVIYVDRGHEAAELFRDIAGELAHAHMDKGNYNREAAGFTASCVAYLLCKRNNIDMGGYQFDIPEAFSSLDSKGIKAELGKIRDIANSITAEMDRLYEKQKEARNKPDAR